MPSALHLIDGDGKLKTESELKAYLQDAAVSTSKEHRTEEVDKEKWVHEVGTDYHVVCIFGGQSSGKSTLLNHLFKTEFQMLDASVRRGQTTQGAFLSVPHLPSTKNDELLLIMDLEGTDGLERGDNQSFERQLSLFGLSVADTLIINMWSVDVGRNNAANLSLLRTIFEMNLHLFLNAGNVKDEKPTLLVVLRDFSASNKAPVLETLRKSFDTVWEGIQKPEAFADAQLDDLFHWKCLTLPHYEFQRAEFDAEVSRLRQQFLVPSTQGYLFQKRSMFRGVPLEGLSLYLFNCWETILSSKDLNIPTQREMLAKHRCSEVCSQEWEGFREKRSAWSERINKGDVLPQLVNELHTEMEARVVSYRRLTKLYNATVVKTYERKLKAKLVHDALEVVEMYATYVARAVLGVVETEAQRIIDAAIHTLVSTGLDDVQSNMLQADKVKDFSINNNNCQEAIEAFWTSICEELQIKLLKIQTSRPPLEQIFGRFTAVVAEDEVACVSITSAITQEIVERIKSRFTSMAANAPDTLHRYFEHSLTHKPDGQLRLSRSVSGLEKLAPLAKQGTLYLLGALLYFRLDIVFPHQTKKQALTAHIDSEEDDDENGWEDCVISLADRIQNRVPKLIVRDNKEEKHFHLRFGSIHDLPIYPTECRVISSAGEHKSTEDGVEQQRVLLAAPVVAQVFTQFSERADTTLMAKMQFIASTRMNVPVWVYAVVLLVSMNEIMYVLSSPLLLLCIVGGIALFGRQYLLQWLEELQDISPPWLSTAIQVVIAYANQASASVSNLINIEKNEARGESNGNRGRDRISISSRSEKLKMD